MRARWVVLATGAVPQALMAAGMSERHTPSGVALRGYVKNDAMVGRITELEVVWHRALTPGYGWIFPCRDGVFNIGVGIADSHAEHKGGKLTKQRGQPAPGVRRLQARLRAGARADAGRHAARRR